MYFNPQVKEKKEDFYNYQILQEELKKAVLDKLIPLIAVYGLRRTGKTSLIHVVLNSLKKKYVWLDGRDIESREDFQVKIANEVRKMKRFSIKTISIKGLQVDIGLFKEGLNYLNQRKTILVIDEAQLLKRAHLDKIVAYIYDNYPDIKIILSGSEIGMLMAFLGKEDAQAPLFGRAVFDIHTHRLEKENSLGFLSIGAKQAKLNFKENEIMETIANLDGIIGWLTKYGWYRLNFSHKEALRKTIQDGKYIAKEEFGRFSIRSEKKYNSILRTLKGGAGWEEIKKKTRISDKQLSSMLKRMTSYGFIEKHDRIYTIADPLLEAAF